MTTPSFFVISVDDKNVITAEAAESRAEADVIANEGIGTINYVAEVINEVDRRSPPPGEIAEEAMKFLNEVIEGRRYSTSPQCLPTAQYRKLVELANQYKKAMTNQEGNQNG